VTGASADAASVTAAGRGPRDAGPDDEVRRGDARRQAARQHHPAGRSRWPTPTAPDPARLAAVLVRVTAEVAAGQRPLSQLEPLVAPALLRRLAADLRAGRRRTDQPEVQRVFTAPPTPCGAVEATVLVDRNGRTTAVAVRLERHRGAWRATELTAPEDGYAPLVTASQVRRTPVRDAFDEAEAEEVALSRRRGSA
jgi:hypothetical protein